MVIEVEGKKYRFLIGHDFIETLLLTPAEKKKESNFFHIISQSRLLKEEGIDLLWTTNAVKKHINQDIIPRNTDDDKSILNKLLFTLLVNIDPDSFDDENLFLSVKKCASKVGYENYLISENEDLIAFVTKLGATFKVINTSEALKKIEEIVTKKGIDFRAR